MSQQQDIQSMPPLAFDTYRVLLPPTAGLALAATVMGTVVQQAHRTTAAALFNGLPIVVAALAIGTIFLGTLVVKRFAKPTINALALASVGGVALGCAGLIASSAVHVGALTMMLQALVAASCAMTQFYWLRKLRGTCAQAAVIVVFCALALSEALVFVLSFQQETVWYALGIVLSGLQLPVIRASRRLGAAADPFPAVSESYFGTDENRFSNRSFLAVAALGIWLISIPIGMGRGFSTGSAIYMSPVPRGMVLLFVLVVSTMWVRFGFASRMRAITTSIWVAMELLLGFGTVCFALCPSTVSIGAAFVMGASLVLQAFAWYLVIAFISFGWRDPYYYCSAAWIAISLLTVAGMRVDALITNLTSANTAGITAIMSLFVLICTQVVFTMLLSSPSEGYEERRDDKTITQDDVRKIPFMGVMAITPPAQTPMVNQKPDVHIATSVLEMGQRFGLTGREVEVLTLYALGHTQARVSEELQLSTNTVHTHIKRIYDKTDLHSRQEILDYISEYGSKRSNGA